MSKVNFAKLNHAIAIGGFILATDVAMAQNWISSSGPSGPVIPILWRIRFPAAVCRITIPHIPSSHSFSGRARNRYPTPRTVSRCRGVAGSSSI